MSAATPALISEKPNLGDLSCYDFQQFQECLKRLRFIDDKIVYALNRSIPTESFKNADASKQCKEVYDQIELTSGQRGSVIKRCINEVSTEIEDLKKTHDHDDMKSVRHLRKAQTSLRLMRMELNVEEVLKDQTLKKIHERCRNYYKPL